MKFVRHIFYALIFFTVICGSSYSQVTQVWTARYNGLLDSIDVAKAITKDNAGNVYVTGYSYTILNLLRNAVTIKYDSNGNEIWRSTYDHSLLDEEGSAITMDNTNQFVYVGGFSTDALTLADYIVLKYNATNGDTVWVRRFNGVLLGDDRVTGIDMDSQNNVIVTGYSYAGLLTGDYNYATVKYDTAGIYFGQEHLMEAEIMKTKHMQLL